MKTLQNTDIRLTDALERQLLQEAIGPRQEYALERAVTQTRKRLASLFRAPEGRVHVSVSTAH